MQLITVVGNAFIELFENDKPMALTKVQLFNYADAISSKLDQSVSISGADITELRLNYDRIISFTQEKTIVPAKNVTIIDLESRFRNNLSTKEINAMSSIQAKKALGIDYAGRTI